MSSQLVGSWETTLPFQEVPERGENEEIPGGPVISLSSQIRASVERLIFQFVEFVQAVFLFVDAFNGFNETIAMWVPKSFYVLCSTTGSSLTQKFLIERSYAAQKLDSTRSRMIKERNVSWNFRPPNVDMQICSYCWVCLVLTRSTVCNIMRT